MFNEENAPSTILAAEFIASRFSREFGTVVQLVSTADANQATATNWSQVNRKQWERVHVVAQELKNTRNELEELKEERAHDKLWHTDLINNFLRQCDQNYALQERVQVLERRVVEVEKELQRVNPSSSILKRSCLESLHPESESSEDEVPKKIFKEH